MTYTDEEWEAAALDELRGDLRAYPGGVRQFVTDHQERLDIGYNALLDNLNGTTKIGYRTFTRAVRILGYSPPEYSAKIATRVAATRRLAANG